MKIFDMSFSVVQQIIKDIENAYTPLPLTGQEQESWPGAGELARSRRADQEQESWPGAGELEY